MKIGRISLLTLLLVVFATLAASAQNAVKWRTTVKMTSEREGVLSVKAIIADSWHLYGMKLPENGPRPTVLDFSASKGVKFTGEFIPSVKPTVKMDPLFDMKISYWTGTVIFTRKFKLTGKKNDALLSGKLTYMACDDSNCLPPKTDTVTLRIK